VHRRLLVEFHNPVNTFFYVKNGIAAVQKNFSIQEMKFCNAAKVLNAIDFIEVNFCLI
jgi:hypothetical protein